MQIKIHDLETNSEIEREMNDEELAIYQAIIDDNNKQAAEVAEKEAARQALLDKLGITADEAKLLLG